MPVVGRRWNRIYRRRWLLQMLPARSIGTEIGVWRGDFSAEILRIVRPRTLYLVDPWLSAGDAAFKGALFDRPQAEMDAIYEGVLHRFAPQIATGRVAVKRTTSNDAAASIDARSLDWVYIDGDHTYEGVAADLANFSARVRAGGLVCGDDYVAGGMFKGGVKRAVDEVVAAGALTLVTVRANQFVLRVPETSDPEAAPT